MADADLILLGQALVFFGTCVTAYTSWRNGHKLTQLNINVDGKLEKLMSAEKTVSRAEGVLQGISDERANPLEPKH
jgi:hypothetical protein